ncbi:hypothetical protein O181_004175 [Austropuccinia psidii MF-1]|uniref:Uncharacterized protein n=1 Tax=Austropuccinia psidii MF-1 TaxID=1389203 RepID=A0A9Q3BGG1_9BASI|nr:hypothetical protein [Austropuccinia psidii MF-1]
MIQYDDMASSQKSRNGTLKTLDFNVENNPFLWPQTWYKKDKKLQLLYSCHRFGKDEIDQGEANRLRMPEPQTKEDGGAEAEDSVSSVSLELMTKDLCKKNNSRHQNNALQA